MQAIYFTDKKVKVKKESNFNCKHCSQDRVMSKILFKNKVEDMILLMLILNKTNQFLLKRIKVLQDKLLR